LQAEFVGFIEHHCIRLLYCISTTDSYRWTWLCLGCRAVTMFQLHAHCPAACAVAMCICVDYWVSSVCTFNFLYMSSCSQLCQSRCTLYRVHTDPRVWGLFTLFRGKL